MSLRISNAELNSLLYSDPAGGYDAGFTNDPAMDQYMYQQEELDMMDMDLQEWNFDREQEEMYNVEYSHCLDDYDWYYDDMIDDIDHLLTVMPVAIERNNDPAPEPKRPMTIAEIIAKHKAELYHEH